MLTEQNGNVTNGNNLERIYVTQFVKEGEGQGRSGDFLFYKLSANKMPFKGTISNNICRDIQNYKRTY